MGVNWSWASWHREHRAEHTSTKSHTTRVPCNHLLCICVPPTPSRRKHRGHNVRLILLMAGPPPCKSESRFGTCRQQIIASHAAKLPDLELEVLGRKSRLAKSSGMRSMAAGLPTTPWPSSLQAQDRSNTNFQEIVKEFQFRSVRNLICASNQLLRRQRAGS